MKKKENLLKHQPSLLSSKNSAIFFVRQPYKKEKNKLNLLKKNYKTSFPDLLLLQFQKSGYIFHLATLQKRKNKLI
jgi:hypothetical protein